MRALWTRLGTLLAEPPSAIRARRLMAADAEPLFEFLADLESQVFLAGRHLEVVHLDGPPGARHGGEMRMSGPLGLRRTVRASVLATLPSRLVIVRADVGRGTIALLSWTLTAQRGTIEIELAAILHSAAVLDRVILRIGGRRLVERRLESTLAALGEFTAIVAEFIGVDPPGAGPSSRSAGSPRDGGARRASDR